MSNSTQVIYPTVLGARIRAARKRQDISVRELARRINVTPSLVSQVETGKVNPSVGSLYAITSNLGISMDDLFIEGDELPDRPAKLESEPAQSMPTGGDLNGADALPLAPPPDVVQETERPTIQLEGGVRWERLTKAHDRQVDFLRTTYEVGGTSSEHLMRHAGKEYGLVTRGRLGLQIGFEKYELRAGESVAFDSTLPHRLWNAGDELVEAIWVVVGRSSGT